MPCDYGTALRDNGRLDARCDRARLPVDSRSRSPGPDAGRPTAFVGVKRAAKTYHFTSEKRVLT